jgi:hypothetical protein
VSPDPYGNWPPDTRDLWLLHGTMGAPIGGVDEDGAGRYVLLRLAAKRNHSDTQDDRTYLLGLDEVVSVLSGLISLGNVAFGRDALREAMAVALHMSDEDRREAAREAAQRLREDMP